MIRSRFGLLSLCAVVFSVMVFGTSDAHAEAGAKWLILDANGTVLTNLEATLGLQAEVKWIMHTEIAGLDVLFLCETITAVGAVLKANGSIGSGAKVRFSNCTTDLNGKPDIFCEPNNEGKEPGVIATKAAHGLLILHKLASGTVDDLVSLLPDVGETFATIEMSEECPIGEKVPVIGKATLKDCEALSLTHLVKHLVEIGPLTELWTISKTAEHVATTLGSAWASLAGAHAGLKFSGDPA
jgi:hypothetical protein